MTKGSGGADDVRAPRPSRKTAALGRARPVARRAGADPTPAASAACPAGCPERRETLRHLVSPRSCLRVERTAAAAEEGALLRDRIPLGQAPDEEEAPFSRGPAADPRRSMALKSGAAAKERHGLAARRAEALDGELFAGGSVLHPTHSYAAQAGMSVAHPGAGSPCGPRCLIGAAPRPTPQESSTAELAAACEAIGAGVGHLADWTDCAPMITGGHRGKPRCCQ